MGIAVSLLLVLMAARAQEGGVAAWDTGQGSATPISTEQLSAKSGWIAIPRDQSPAPFQGDAVVTNGRILVAARKQSPAIDVYALAAGKATSRARLVLLGAGGDRAVRFDRVALAEYGRAGAVLDLSYSSAKGSALSAKLRIKRGDVSVEMTPVIGTERLRVECSSRFAVLPDFFADDILVDAQKMPGPATEVPSENFLMNMVGGGDAIVMTVSESREQEIRITLSGEREQRLMTGSEIAFGGTKKIWVALLEGPGIWHSIDLKKDNAQKVIPLDWKMPFVAQWRVDFSRPNDLVDGWDMLLQNKKGQDYIKPAWFGGPAEEVNDATRRRFTEVLGFFPYPCWSDPERRGFVQPLEVTTRTKFVSVLTYEGPMVLYPLNRLKETPPEVFTVIDVARNALGMGPCEYVLDLENQKQEYKGLATCNTREALIKIYEKGEQKKKRAEIEKLLDDDLAFVTHIRGRITHYIDFGHRIRDFLAARKKEHPELTDRIAELERIVEEMDARFAEREERIKTPAHVAKMNEEFRKEVLDDDGPDALERCKKYAEALVRIGGHQDKLVSECRWVARTLRQRAGFLMAMDPRLDAVAAEVRTRAQEALRNPSWHERARQ